MNFQQALDLMWKVLRSFEISYHDGFLTELSKLLKTTIRGHEEVFFGRLVSIFRYVEAFGVRIKDVDNHEILSHMKGGPWYSLHLKTSYINLRILMTFWEGEPVLLACFNEKSGKRKPVIMGMKGFFKKDSMSL